jgi:hypothetical protein
MTAAAELFREKKNACARQDVRTIMNGAVNGAMIEYVMKPRWCSGMRLAMRARKSFRADTLDETAGG